MAAPWTTAIARLSVEGFTGTGFLVSSDGLVLTAFHVIGDRKESLAAGRAIFYDGPIRARFGAQGDERWTCDAVLEPNKYSIEEDWALLRVPRPVSAEPLALAKFVAANAPGAFKVFGFPRHDDEIGGEYLGQIATWRADLVEAHIDKDLSGLVMGGISGAPLEIGGSVVAMVLQCLSADANKAVKASLHARPIERAVRGAEGLLGWDDGNDLTFQAAVERHLPDDPGVLVRAGAALGVPPAASIKRTLARRLLSTNLGSARAALIELAMKPDCACHVMERLGAMQLHDDAVAYVRTAGTKARPALLTSARKRVQRWFLHRAYAPEVVSELKIAIVRAEPGGEEVPGGDAAVVDALVARIRTRLREQGLGAEAISAMMSADVKPLRRFWIVLVGESRFDVLAAVAKRVPNARVIGASAERLAVPDRDRDLVDVVAPTMSEHEERDLIEQWELIAGDLMIPIEAEEDV